MTTFKERTSAVSLTAWSYLFPNKLKSYGYLHHSFRCGVASGRGSQDALYQQIVMGSEAQKEEAKV